MIKFSRENAISSVGKIVLCVIMMLSGVVGVYGQFSLFEQGQAKKKRGSKPTVITAESMDFDISQNIAVFTGNVQVDDEDMKIFCQQMIIRFEKMGDGKKNGEKGKGESPLGKGGKSGSVSLNMDQKSGKTTVKDITCLKDVIIIRKLYDDKEKAKGEQKALADKAHYDVKTGKITLSENPSLTRGSDTLRGDVIYFWRDSERVSVRNNSELKLRSSTFKKEGERK